MPYHNIEIFIEKLLKKSLLGMVKWEPTADENVFKVTFSKYIVTISKHTERDIEENKFSYDEEDSSYYVLSLYNIKEILIDRISDTDLVDQIEDAHSYFKGIYDSARRISMGIDEVIEELIDELGEDGKKVP